jgi:hypothetical protein
MQDPSNRADHYRKEAAKYHELAKLARPDFLGVAVRYLFMAEDLSRSSERRRRVVEDRGSEH